MGSGPEKVAQISETQMQHREEKCLDACIPMLWERMEPFGCMLVHIKGFFEGLMV